MLGGAAACAGQQQRSEGAEHQADTAGRARGLSLLTRNRSMVLVVLHKRRAPARCPEDARSRELPCGWPGAQIRCCGVM